MRRPSPAWPAWALEAKPSKVAQQHIWEKITDPASEPSPTLSASYGYEVPAPLILSTFVKAQKAHDPDDCERWEESPAANTLSERDGSAPATLVAFAWDDYNQAATEELTPTLCQKFASVYSAEASPARTSAPPASEPASPANDPASSSSSHESLTLFSPLEDGSSLRTFPDYFPPTVAEISPSFLRRWPSSGFTISPGESWTADTSECPRGEGASTYLRDVLEETVPAGYYLSQRAAAGIIRRASRRGRTLPPTLEKTLREMAPLEP